MRQEGEAMRFRGLFLAIVLTGTVFSVARLEGA